MSVETALGITGQSASRIIEGRWADWSADHPALAPIPPNRAQPRQVPRGAAPSAAAAPLRNAQRFVRSSRRSGRVGCQAVACGMPEMVSTSRVAWNTSEAAVPRSVAAYNTPSR